MQNDKNAKLANTIIYLLPLAALAWAILIIPLIGGFIIGERAGCSLQ